MRSIVLAAFEGALAGAFAGAVLGVWHAVLNEDAGHGMWFLLAWRIDRFVFTGLLAGAGVSSLLAAMAGFVRWRPRAFVVVLPIVAVAGLLAVEPVRRAAWLTLRPPGSANRDAWLIALLFLIVFLDVLRLRAREGQRENPSRPPVRAVVGLAVAVVAMAVHFALPAVASRRAAGHPSVVLISLDTVRADRLGVAGYARPLTPALDRLAEEGATFLQATSTAPWTFPAHLSMLTSTLPFDAGKRIWRAGPEMVLLAEIYRNAGYRTRAHAGGTWVDARIGFAQGFERFQTHDEIEEHGAAGYFAKAADWIEGLDGAPFFLFLHTYEAHIPYTHREFARADAPPTVGETFDVDDLETLRDGTFVPDETERAYVIDLYDGDVAAADAYVGAFLERLDRIRPAEDVVVVVVSDHGEDLWDHFPERSADHGHSLYEELLLVPWILRKTGDVPARTRIENPVSLLAVAPTLVELAGLPRHRGHRGRNLAPNLREGIEPAIVPLYAEMVEYGPDRFSVREGDLKLILTPLPDEVHNEVYLPSDTLEVFDLARDPLERTNLGADDVARWRLLKMSLEWRAVSSLGVAAATSDLDAIPEELREQMRALGYTQ